MRIGIFSKIEMAGGSEFRCAELANGIAKHTFHKAFLLSEKKIPSRIRQIVCDQVSVIEHVMDSDENMVILYDMDCLIIVNTDCKNFSTLDYWTGKSPRHSRVIDLSRIRRMVFLYNFLVSPSRHLHTIQDICNDIRIIVTNNKFYNEIDNQDRYKLVRGFPRLRLESPIDPDKISIEKILSDKIRIGCLSKSLDSKWNEDYPELISIINNKYRDRIYWRFMGMNSKIAKQLSGIPNVTIFPEFDVPVKDFLKQIDIFLFFPSWKREEPWSRSVGEAIMSGCPVITSYRGGNPDQVKPEYNGFLCKSLTDFETSISSLIDNPSTRKRFAENAIQFSKTFTSKAVINKLIEFVK